MRTLDRAKPVIPITTWGRRAVSSYRPTDALVATKFHVPRAGWVPRPRLLAGLAQGIGRGLTVACTPAGFGKTTLLGDWARRSRVPVAWLSLDVGDNDPARVLAVCGGGAGGGAARAEPTGRRAAGWPAAAAVRGRGDRGDQPAGGGAQCGCGRAGRGRLPPDRGVGGARRRNVLAGAAAAGTAPGAGQPGRPAAAASAASRPRP